MTAARSPRVELYVDPCCPFAWIAWHWLLEVRRQRDLAVRLRLMSLFRLNEGRDVPPGYRALLDKTVAPARVAAAVLRHHGEDAAVALYQELGTRIFGREDHYRVILAGLDPVISDAVVAVGLPAALADAAHDTGYDDVLGASHDRAVAAAGDDLGTPVMHVDGNAFFGPVLTRVPRGPDALQVFEGVRLLAGHPEVVEFKRRRRGALDYRFSGPEGDGGGR